MALDDLKVVELPTLDAMPFFAATIAAKAFAELGAEVVKVEPPKTGSRERNYGPFAGTQPDPETRGLHLYFNTNKRGVTLNLEDPRGVELLMRLLARADIVFNPNPPALNERLGTAWRTLCERHPRLIVVSLTYFGAESAYRDLRGGNLVAAQMSGVANESPWCQVTDPENQPPLIPAEHGADHMAAFTGAAAAMAALFARKQTGAGQHVDVNQWLAMSQCLRPNIAALSHEGAQSLFLNFVLTRFKYNYQWVFPCRDGWVGLRPTGLRFWPGMVKLMGNPEWAQSEAFATEQSRMTNFDAVEAGVISWLAEHDREEIFQKARLLHVPCFPVYDAAEVDRFEQFKARGFFAQCDHPVAGRVRMPGPPYKLSRTPARINHAAPLLGADNRTVYHEWLNIGADELGSLTAAGVI